MEIDRQGIINACIKYGMYRAYGKPPIEVTPKDGGWLVTSDGVSQHCLTWEEVGAMQKAIWKQDDAAEERSKPPESDNRAT